MKRVCVFCGSSSGAWPEYADAARAFGRALVRRDFGLVFGGGRVGLMGVIADSVIEEAGDVIGVIPRALATKELLHPGVFDMRVVATMHERKALMAELADAFVSLPGGLGTLEEFFEILTWAQLGIHRKPCAILEVGGFSDMLLTLLDSVVEQGFLRPEHRRLVYSHSDPERVLNAIEAYRPPDIPRWVDPGEA